MISYSETNIFKLITNLIDKGNAPTSVWISEVKRLVIGCLIASLISFLFGSHIKGTTLFYVIYLIKHLDVRRKHSRCIFVSLLGVCHVLCLLCYFFPLLFFFIIIIFIYLFISLTFIFVGRASTDSSAADTHRHEPHHCVSRLSSRRLVPKTKT